ncbi:hypothetical protein V6N13_114074 [Hibiscus sabdariffa]|uniref:Uncharacterized protein n=1 Tax=Hibiscus sabdariffa TaxID=183260 RepID=A0ABR2U0R5_9ROSI
MLDGFMASCVDEGVRRWWEMLNGGRWYSIGGELVNGDGGGSSSVDKDKVSEALRWWKVVGMEAGGWLCRTTGLGDGEK